MRGIERQVDLKGKNTPTPDKGSNLRPKKGFYQRPYQYVFFHIKMRGIERQIDLKGEYHAHAQQMGWTYAHVKGLPNLFSFIHEGYLYTYFQDVVSSTLKRREFSLIHKVVKLFEKAVKSVIVLAVYGEISVLLSQHTFIFIQIYLTIEKY